MAIPSNLMRAAIPPQGVQQAGAVGAALRGVPQRMPMPPGAGGPMPGGPVPFSKAARTPPPGGMPPGAPGAAMPPQGPGMPPQAFKPQGVASVAPNTFAKGGASIPPQQQAALQAAALRAGGPPR